MADRPNGQKVIETDAQGRLYIPRSVQIWCVIIVLGGGFVSGGGANVLQTMFQPSVPVEVTAPQIEDAVENAVEEAIEPIERSVQQIESHVRSIARIQSIHLDASMHEGAKEEFLLVKEKSTEIQGQVNLLVRELIDKPARAELRGENR